MGNSLGSRQKITRVVKGEVWYAYDEKSTKIRPFLIISEELSGIEVDISVVPTTTQEKRNPFDIDIEFWKEAGLSKPSTARCSKIHYISHMFLKRKLGSLDERDLEKVNEAMRQYLGL